MTYIDILLLLPVQAAVVLEPHLQDWEYRLRGKLRVLASYLENSQFTELALNLLAWAGVMVDPCPAE